MSGQMPGIRYWATAATAVSALAPSAAWAQQVGESWRFGCGPGMMGWGGGWAGLIVMPLLMLLVLAAVIAFMVMILRTIGGPPRLPPGRGALEILNERFARGEIDKQEFDERRRVLGG